MRVAFLSDAHLATCFDDGSLFPRQLNRLDPPTAEASYNRMRDACSDAFSAVTRRLSQDKPNVIVALGDLVNGWQEQGIYHAKTQQIARDTAENLENIAPHVLFAIGNHETGYSHPGSLPGSGLRTDSIVVCQATFGHLWWTHQVEGTKLIGLCSPIAEHREPDPAIQDLALKQLEFLHKTLSSHSEPWILCSHSPCISRSLATIIEPHLNRMIAFVYGDLHNPRWGAIKRFTPGWSVQARCLRRGICCPSTAPLWWPGMDTSPTKEGCSSNTNYRQSAAWDYQFPIPSRPFFGCYVRNI